MRTFTQAENERHLYQRRLMAEGKHRFLLNKLKQAQDGFENERQQRRWEQKQAHATLERNSKTPTFGWIGRLPTLGIGGD